MKYEPSACVLFPRPDRSAARKPRVTAVDQRATVIFESLNLNYSNKDDSKNLEHLEHQFLRCGYCLLSPRLSRTSFRHSPPYSQAWLA
jgi:hypothetical protein